VAEPVAATQWQYRGDDGWVDFDSDSCATLSTVVGETQLVIGERIYSVDAERTFQTNPVTGYRRAIRRAPSAPAYSVDGVPDAPIRTRQPGAHAGRGVWEWQKWANGPWAPYDRSTNAIIVAAYGRGEGSVVAVTNGYRHNVDFGRGTAKDLTTGAIHAIHHSVDGVPVADAPPPPPQEPTPELQRRVHELVRAGKPISEKDARAYSRTLTEAQYTNQNKALLGFHRGNTCCCVLNHIGGPCLCSVPVCFLPCFPLNLFMCCLGREDPDHRFVARGEYGEETNSCVIVDHERGTFACFNAGAFCCYFEKM
jgi:hypothetical protein